MNDQQDRFITALFAAHFEELVRYAYGYSHDWGRAEEAAQDAFQTACERIAVVMLSDSPLGWLKLTAKNMTLNMERGRRRQRLQPFPESGEPGLPASAPCELALDVLYASVLTEAEFYLLLRVVIDGATSREMAKELSIQPWACQKRLQRIKQKFRDGIQGPQRGPRPL